jgi:hypothetical protein
VRTPAAIAGASVCLPAGMRGTARLAVPGGRGEKQVDVAYGEQVVPDLGAFCRVSHAGAGPARDGPLDGLTFSVKDIFDVAGSRTGFGQPAWLESHPPAAGTAPHTRQRRVSLRAGFRHGGMDGPRSRRPRTYR